MERVVINKHQPAARRFSRALLISRTVLAPALAVALLIYARSSFPTVLARALAHTSKGGMFFFCNGILLTLIARPQRRCAKTDYNQRSRFAPGSRNSGSVVGGQGRAVSGKATTATEVASIVAKEAKATATTAVVKELERGRRGEGHFLIEDAEEGDMFEDNSWEDVAYEQPEDDMGGSDDECQLSLKELNRKANEFIENFKRQRRFEAMQTRPVAAR